MPLEPSPSTTSQIASFGTFHDLRPARGVFGWKALASTAPRRLSGTLPETNSSHLKIDGWNKSFPCGIPYFQGRTVSFRECTRTPFFLQVCCRCINVSCWFSEFLLSDPWTNENCSTPSRWRHFISELHGLIFRTPGSSSANGEVNSWH